MPTDDNEYQFSLLICIERDGICYCYSPGVTMNWPICHRQRATLYLSVIST